MDINSLLSPSESPRSTPGPNAKTSASKTRRPRTTSNLSGANERTAAASTPNGRQIAPTTFSNNGSSQSPTSIPIPGAMAAAQGFRTKSENTPPGEGHRGSRQPSTPGMDALADLASMQHHQQTARVNAGGFRNTEIYDKPTSASGSTGSLPTISSIPRSQATTHILRGASFDRAMIDAPAKTPSPQQFTTSSLAGEDQERVTQLAAAISANPFSYEANVQLINVLHQGLREHRRNQKSPGSYSLLQELQSAREAMSSRFALGEDLLTDWVEDQILLADTLETCITVMELCQKTVEEEPSSTKLWAVYGNWLLRLYKIANNHDETLAEIGGYSTPEPSLSEEDKTVAREIFTWQILMDVWRRGSQATTHMFNDSHLVWDPYMELRLFELGSRPARDVLASVEMDFQNRLRTPHDKWDQTFQAYSTFINRYDTQNYEEAMVTVNKNSKLTKQKNEARQFRELRLHQASDREAELQAFAEYIDYESNLDRRKPHFDFDLVNALYQRATLRFPANTELWESYVMFYIEELTTQGRSNLSAIPVLEKATRHCPWSGNLWAQYLLTAEIEKMPFSTIGEIKHKATSTGLLDAGSMDEILKVHTAWCGFLRRRAFQEGASDEDADVAEVGIRSAIEDMETTGRTKYGNEYAGDPQYRLEKIYIKYLTQGRHWDAARDAWRKLIPRKGGNYEFWLRYYAWEMTTWCKLAFGENDPVGGKFTKPVEATKVLERALMQTHLDWPEKMIETYHYHCEDHEDAVIFQAALLRISKAEKAVKLRREREAYEALEQAKALRDQEMQDQAQEELINTVEEGASGKRKREGDLNDDDDDGPSKRSREDLNTAESQVPERDAPAADSAIKRDREHSTVIVKNIPHTASETRVRQFFRDCGIINTLKLLQDTGGNSITATVEFESKDDVVFALTKDNSILDGNVIEVKVGGGDTIYVCNFPPTADEQWMREKFQQFGDIIDVRFPSLRYNTHRRFCYIQFRLAESAKAATQLDGEDQGDNLKLLAKISDPAHKKSREGAIHEGRELHILNLDRGATEKDVKQAFKRHGYVENVRIPRRMNGSSKGFGFIVFRDKQAATAALEMNNTTFRNRIINVTISTTDKSAHAAIAHSATSSQRATNSPVASHHDPPPQNGSDPSAITASSSPPSTNPTKDSSALKAEISSRTLVLLNLPDTINDARIRALCAPHGPLTSIRLRLNHGGAIAEYADVASVGKAALALEGFEIAPGRPLRIGSVAELKREGSEWRSDKIADRTKVGTQQQGLIGSGVVVKRPGMGKRGGKGGLGVKRGVGRGSGGGGGEINGEEKEKEGEGGGKAKSNQDFRDLVLGK